MALFTVPADPLPIIYFSFFIRYKSTVILFGMILNLVRVFYGFEYCFIPFLSITKSTFGKINWDYYLKKIILILVHD